MVISLIITGCLVIFSILLKHSKILYFLDFSWMWIQLAYCTDFNRVDYPNYVRRYNLIMQDDIKSTEYGYAWLNKILYGLNFDFDTAYAIMMLLTLIAIAIWIPKVTTQYTEAAALMLIYPLYVNGIQIRSFIASVFIMYSIKYLIRGDKKSLVIYCLFCLIAASIQSSSIIYLLLIIPRKCNAKKLVIYTFLMAFGSFFIIRFFNSFFSLIFGADRFEEKTMIKNTIIEAGMIGVWQLTFLLTILLLTKIVIKEDKTYTMSTADRTVLKILIFLSFLIPMYTMDFSLERILRGLLPLYYCYFFNMVKRVNSERRIYVKGMFYGWFVITALIFNIFVSDRWNIIMKAFLCNNDVINNPLNHLGLFFILSICLFYIFVFDINCVRKSDNG